MTRPRPTRWTNLVPAPVREGVRAQIRDDAGPELVIYDVIDEWGGEWGVSASDVVTALSSLGDVPALAVRLNSPGGSYFEGVTIAHALARHPATVTVYVDGLAASAASVIAMGGDRIVMGQGSQMMIHEASGMAWGTADEMRRTAGMLDQTNDDIAAMYAARTGGDQATWRAAVSQETWYTAAQAVAEGLADEVVALPQRAAPPPPVENAAPAADPIVAPAASTDEQAIVEQQAHTCRCPTGEHAPPTPDASSPAPDAPPATELPTAAAPDDAPVPPALPLINLAELIRSSVRKAIPA